MSDRLAAAIERRVSSDEARDYLEQPVTDAEREGVLSLVRWFRSRYPAPIDRLAYARRAYMRWAASASQHGALRGR